MEQHHDNPGRETVVTLPSSDDRRAAIAHHMAALEDLAEPSSRIDGWTPFARKLFLQVLAETGRVTTACEFAQLSKQSAYALRTRDPIFAAGWDAACELARMPLADALYEQALDGVTETITRDDGRTATRHRFDSRLSVAVLNRLDRRCDQAAEQGSRHLGAVRRWHEFTAAVGEDDQGAAQAILDAAEDAKLSQASQLPDNLMEDDQGDDDAPDRIWWDDDFDEWRTDFSPPEGFDGSHQGKPGEYGYWRTLASEELALVTLECATRDAEDRAVDEAARDAFFSELRVEFAPSRHPGLDSGSTLPSIGASEGGTRVEPGTT